MSGRDSMVKTNSRSLSDLPTPSRSRPRAARTPQKRCGLLPSGYLFQHYPAFSYGLLPFHTPFPTFSLPFSTLSIAFPTFSLPFPTFSLPFPTLSLSLEFGECQKSGSGANSNTRLLNHLAPRVIRR